MGTFGSGGAFALFDHLLFGRNHNVTAVHVHHDVDGSRRYVVHSTERTWGKLLSKSRSNTANSLLRYKPSEDTIRPLTNKDDLGLLIGDHRYLPVNAKDEVVMTEGRVLNLDSKTIANGDTRITGYKTKTAPLRKRIANFCVTPDRWTGAIAILFISGCFDYGIFRLGESRGKHHIIKRIKQHRPISLVETSKPPSDGKMMLNAISPIPLTLSPLAATFTSQYEGRMPKRGDGNPSQVSASPYGSASSSQYNIVS